MVFDFGSLQVPGQGSKETEPRALLKSLPVRQGAINDLWDGQAQALAAWHARRTASDNLVSLNTGAGKTIVGLIIAESLRRETSGNVVYVCPNNDLIEQVSKEASKLGLDHTIRATGGWSNDLYERGRAICITNYQSILNNRTVFREERTPNAVILDDAHVTEGLIRDQFTLRIGAKEHANIFSALKMMIQAHERDAGYGAKIAQVFAGASNYSTIMIAPTFGRDRSAELNQLFTPYLNADPHIAFPLSNLFGKWSLCVFCISAAGIEVSVPALPTLSYRLFKDPDIRRVYLSATLGQAVDFARTFGREIPEPIQPDVDAGNGERLILFSELLGGEKVEHSLISAACSLEKLLIAVPSGRAALRWAEFAKPPEGNFSQELEAFRQKKSTGAFVLVGRYDGIDLPQDTCRQMVLDGVPRGVSLLERFCWEYLDLKTELRSRIATRITQLFGRIIRGRVDNGVFYILDRQLNIWLGTDRNLALLPELLANQIKLGAHIHEALGVDSVEKAEALAKQVLSRDEGWVRYYRDWVNSLKVDDAVIAKAVEQQSVIKDVAVRWVQYWSALWGAEAPEKITRLRDSLEELLPRLASVDTRGAGWLDIWLGTRYAADGLEAFAADHFSRARTRLLAELPLPRAVLQRGALEGVDISPLGAQFLEIFGNGVIEANRRIGRDDAALAPLTGADCSTNEYEEALRFLGDRLGFAASRPDNDEGTGPDVLWVSTADKGVIAWEAKTEKTTDTYNKADIGQAHQHAEWVRQRYAGFDLIAVVLVGRPTAVTEEAGPSDDMWGVLPEELGGVVARYKDLREAVSREFGASREAQVAKLGEADEWAIRALFERLTKVKLKT